MAIEGSLAAGGGAELLAALTGEGRTGILDLTAAGVGRKFVFRGGEIIYLISEERTEKLPLRLVARGRAPKETVIEAAKSGENLRAALVERGVAGEQYDAELRAMIADAVRAVFPVTEGSFSFVDKADLQLEGVLEENPVTGLYWEAARSCPAEQAAAWVGPTAARIQRSGDDDQLMALPGLDPQDGFILSRIDGYGAVDDLVAASPAGADPVIALVFALGCAGFVQVTNRPGLRLPKGAAGKAGGGRKPAPKKAAPSGPSAAEQAKAAAAAMAAESESTPVEERDPLELAKELHRKTADADHYRVLGVPPEMEQAEIRKTYYGLAKTLHPDRFPRDLPPSDRELVEDLFARIGEAFGVLNDPDSRKEYDEKLKSGALLAEKKETERVDPKELAKTSYQKALGLTQMGEKERALRFFEHAVEQDGENWDYRVSLAKAYMEEPRLRRKAEPHLKEAMRINESRAESYYQLGLLYLKANVKSRALEQLKLGHKWDPEHAGINEELAKLGEGGGGDDDKSSGGLLGGLFGKKS